MARAALLDIDGDTQAVCDGRTCLRWVLGVGCWVGCGELQSVCMQHQDPWRVSSVQRKCSARGIVLCSD
jgi:hypothetical protein